MSFMKSTRVDTGLIGFIDAESEIGAAFSERIEGDIARVPAHQVARWRAALGPSPNEARAQRWLTTFLPHRKRAAAFIQGPARAELSRKQQDVLDGLSLKTLAGIAGLSPSRFMHVLPSRLEFLCDPTFSGSGSSARPAT